VKLKHKEQLSHHHSQASKNLRDHEKKLEKAMKLQQNDRKALQERFDKFVAKHEAVRDEKRKIEKDFEAQKNRDREQLVREENEYRKKRDRSNEEFLEKMHKQDLEWGHRMHKHYTEQHRQLEKESLACMSELKRL
jgi:hypothetical protein